MKMVNRSPAKLSIRSEPGGELSDGSDLESDAQGRWKVDTAPPGDLVVRVLAVHPDFICMHSYYDMNQVDPLPIEELCAQTAKQVLKRGIRVTGTVTDPSGKPVAGALAIWGNQPYWEHRPHQEVFTDEQGVYRFPPLSAGPMRVTIVAKGWMPDMRQIEIVPKIAPVDFQVKPGKTLRIRVVDNEGTPVPKTWFGIESWRDAESLYNYRHPNVIDSKIPNYADKNGIYAWNWAPDDPVTFRISAGDNFCQPEATFTADDQEHDFKLLPILRISGRVTDAKTDRPIKRFTVVKVEDLSEYLSFTYRHQAKESLGGQYVSDRLDRTDVAHRVRIEADGYRSAISGPFHVGDRNPTADFQLEPAPPASGRVLDADGKPVMGAKVYLATRAQELFNPRSKERNDYSDNFCLLTNERGEFSFPAQCDRYTVMVVDDSGYAETDLQPDQIPGDLKLQKWARIEGTLWQAGKPVPNAAIDFNPLRPALWRLTVYRRS